MSVFVLSDGAAYLGSAVISPYLDGIAETTGEAQMVEYKRLDGGGFKHFKPSLATFRTRLAGAVGFDTGEIGATLIAARNQQYGLSIVPQRGSAQTVGDPAIIHRGLVSSVKTPSGATGDLARHEFAMTSDLIQTVGVVGAPLASRTGSSAFAEVAMTGPTATQSMYLAVHVTVAAGTNLTVILQSDDNAGFNTPTDRITSATVSATGWQFLSVAGSLTSETHWRISYTTSSGSFTFFAAFGVA
jgi:hypothetical protein